MKRIPRTDAEHFPFNRKRNPERQNNQSDKIKKPAQNKFPLQWIPLFSKKQSIVIVSHSSERINADFGMWLLNLHNYDYIPIDENDV